MDKLLVPIIAIIMFLLAMAACIEAYYKKAQIRTKLTFMINHHQKEWLRE